MTAEFAVLLPGFVLMLAVSLSAAQAATAQLRCLDAARSAARLAARGETSGAVLAAAGQAAPQGARVRLATTGDLVRVEVTVPVPMLLPGRPRLVLSAASTARREDVTAGAPPGAGRGPRGRA